MKYKINFCINLIYKFSEYINLLNKKWKMLKEIKNFIKEYQIPKK